ncbi:Ras-like GTP-binding protein RYL2 [Ceratobasidium sp. AG-Ba]|nr:Ras-like GTP-binding protein RYL2 [Ceratobasidium sp. AG-Ba]
MNDMYEPCPPKRPSLRASNTRVTLTNTQSSLDAKVVIMGSAGVGKTSLVTRYVEERFAPQTTTTTGAFFHSKKVTVDGTKVRLQIWDTAGQERFRSMAPMYYRGASAAILVYDITNASSFDDVKVWIEGNVAFHRVASIPADSPYFELKRNCDPDLLIYIVGAKADLAAHGQRVVTSERAQLALHTWFPPPPPPPSASTASTAPGTPKTEGVYDMYIRPRLPSLASTRSVPFMFSSATMGAIGTVTTGRLGSPGGGEVSSGASATSSSSGGKKRLGHAHSQSYSFATRLEDEGYGGEELVYPSEERGRVRRRARSSGRELEVAAAEFARSGASGWASRRGRSFEDVLMEDEDEEQSWGLSKGMELREVSAKDDRGIQNLFNAIIGQIIKRKDVLERERAARERDSITLGTNSLLEPSWGGIADKEEATLARRGKWSCCAV